MRFGGFILLGVLAAVLFAFLFGYFVMLLWNWLMPVLFGLGVINYWQAIGIILLARLIFGFSGHGSRSRRTSDHSKFRRSFKHGNGRCDHRKWKYYDRFWKEKGEAAFDEYIDDIETDVEEKEEPKE
jgi:hypothetical protein